MPTGELSSLFVPFHSLLQGFIPRLLTTAAARTTDRRRSKDPQAAVDLTGDTRYRYTTVV